MSPLFLQEYTLMASYDKPARSVDFTVERLFRWLDDAR
jgi:hypothetical protein